MKPPTLAELLQDKSYRKYMKTRPVVIPTMAIGNPWKLWIETNEGKWRTGDFPTYDIAWARAVAALRNPEYRDVAVVSRRTLYAPPPGITWPRDLSWCARCRRPSRFAEFSDRHHALRKVPALTTDSPYRCWYCGIREAGMPAHLLVSR